jgi:hypothetical protein
MPHRLPPTDPDRAELLALLLRERFPSPAEVRRERKRPVPSRGET